MTREDAAVLAATLKALTDPTRVRMVEAVAAHPGITAAELYAVLGTGLTGPTHSHHVAVLKKAGLVAAEREGLNVRYTLVPGVVSDLASAIGALG